MGGESVADVVSRLARAMEQIEMEFEGYFSKHCVWSIQSTQFMQKFTIVWACLWIIYSSAFYRRAILIVSHGDPLQMLQTILSAAKEQDGSNSNSFASRIEAIKVPSILSKHRNFALETGELRAVI